MRSIALLLLLTFSAGSLAVESYNSQPSVDAAFATYLRVLQNRVKESRLAIYSSETRKLLAALAITDAQQAAELREIEAVYSNRVVRESGDLGVLLFPGSKRVPPYFFRREGGAWTIDLSVMRRVIGFDNRNQWYVRDKTSEFSALLN